MKRKNLFYALSILLTGCLLLGSCTDGSESSRPQESSESHAEDSTDATSSEEDTVSYVYDGEESFSNRTLANNGARMGDEDGPAYCVYSTQGVQAASMEIELSQLEVQIYREDKKHVNAYIFLGVDVYNEAGGYWVNCADAGLVYSGSEGWHVFYNIYSVADPENTSTWYESSTRLRNNCDYRLTLDSSQTDGQATLTVYNLTTGRVADHVTFELQYARKDGSNTSYLTDFALDYPENTMQDPDGNPSEDWVAITLGNTDRGMYLRNVRVKNCSLTRDGTSYDWTADQTANRGIWPDASMSAIDYPCTSIRNAKENISYIVDLDMNR